jgi:hypothetical protein
MPHVLVARGAFFCVSARPVFPGRFVSGRSLSASCT